MMWYIFSILGGGGAEVFDMRGRRAVRKDHRVVMLSCVDGRAWC